MENIAVFLFKINCQDGMNNYQHGGVISILTERGIC